MQKVEGSNPFSRFDAHQRLWVPGSFNYSTALFGHQGELSPPQLAAQHRVAALELLDGGAGDGARPGGAIDAAWTSRCDFPVRRATSATRRLRSPRSRSRVA